MSACLGNVTCGVHVNVKDNRYPHNNFNGRDTRALASRCADVEFDVALEVDVEVAVELRPL